MTNWQVETRKLKNVTWFRQLRYQRPLCRKHLWERATPGFVPGKQIRWTNFCSLSWSSQLFSLCAVHWENGERYVRILIAKSVLSGTWFVERQDALICPAENLRVAILHAGNYFDAISAVEISLAKVTDGVILVIVEETCKKKSALCVTSRLSKQWRQTNIWEERVRSRSLNFFSKFFMQLTRQDHCLLDRS